MMKNKFLQINISPALSSQLVEVRNLMLEGVKEKLLLNRTEQEVSKLIEDGLVAIALHENKVVGIAILDFYSKRLSELRSLYVLKKYRKVGVGKSLVEYVFHMAKEKGVKELMTITTKNMVPWFLTQGFKEETQNLKISLFRNI